MLLFTYECNEQSTAELQKLSVFHTTVTYATAKLHILFEMDNQNTENIVNGHIFSSSEVTEITGSVLLCCKPNNWFIF